MMRLALAVVLCLALVGCKAFIIPAAAGFIGTVGGNIASDKIEGK